MDRLELRTKFAASVHKVPLEGIEIEVCIRKLSALDRARIIDKYRMLEKNADGDDRMEKMTIETQCFVVSRGLVTETGVRIYKDDEAAAIADEFPCDVLDRLSQKIIDVSGMGKSVPDPVKNFEPTLSAASSSALQ